MDSPQKMHISKSKAEPKIKNSPGSDNTSNSRKLDSVPSAVHAHPILETNRDFLRTSAILIFVRIRIPTTNNNVL